jgi:hypothetical protein
VEELIGYVDKTFKHGADISASLENLVAATITKPKDPATNVEKEKETNKEIWKQEIRAYVARKATLEENLQKAYALIWGQCSDALRAKLEGAPTHRQVASDKDSIALLKSIRASMFMSHAQRYEPLAILEGMERFIRLHQGRHQSLASYLESFKNCSDVLDYMTVKVGVSENGLKAELTRMTDEFGTSLTLASANRSEIGTARSSVKESFMAVKFLAGADKARYGTVIQDLENDFTKKDDKFPKTVVDAYNLLMHWKHTPAPTHGTPNHGVAFTVDGNEDATTLTNYGDGSDDRGRGGGRGGRGRGGRGGRGGGGRGSGYGRGNCHRCGEAGHYAAECPNELPSQREDETAEQLLMAGVENDEYEEVNFMFHQQGCDESQYAGGNKCISREWILLDNQSTVDVFCNPDLLKDIRTTKRSMTIRCNAGVTRTNMIGRMDGYPGEIWYNPSGIANILSLSNVTKHFPVSYNSDDDRGFVIHKPAGDRRFKQSPRGLFYFDASEHMRREGTTLVNSGMERHNDALPVEKTGVCAPSGDTAEPIPPTHGGVENVVGMTCEELVRMNEGGVTLINTVEENKTLYNASEQARALLARKIQNMIGHPSTKDFKKIVSSGRMLPNCPITTRDIAAAEDIFGPSLACLEGKTVRRSSPAVVHFEAEPVPPGDTREA